MTNNIDDLKRGSEWYRELRPDPVAFGKKFADRFERLLKFHHITYKRSSDEATEGKGDGGWDFKVWQAAKNKWLSIDVKGTDYVSNVLLLVEKGHAKSSLYVQFSQSRLMGWATREDVLKRAPRYHPTTVNNHIIPAHELRDVKGLWAMLKGEVG